METMIYYRLIVDVWKLMRTALESQDPDYAAKAVAKAGRIRQQHGDSKFAQDILLAVLSEIERKKG